MEITTSAPPAEDVAIEFRGVEKRFGANLVLDGVSLRVERGTSAVVMGGSGEGKSVLICDSERLARRAR